MATQKKTAAPKPAAPRGTKARAEAVKKILLNVERKMAGEELKATLGDYIKLIQLQKEMGQESVQELKVTWVEPEEPPSDD